VKPVVAPVSHQQWREAPGLAAPGVCRSRQSDYGAAPGLHPMWVTAPRNQRSASSFTSRMQHPPPAISLTSRWEWLSSAADYRRLLSRSRGIEHRDQDEHDDFVDCPLSTGPRRRRRQRPRRSGERSMNGSPRTGFSGAHLMIVRARHRAMRSACSGLAAAPPSRREPARVERCPDRSAR
jgi:hypothetical protein